MAALSKKDLVNGNKYNRAEGMKRAWLYVKSPFTTMYRNDFGWALQRAWLDAKEVMEEQNAPEPECYFKPNRSVEMLRACSCSDNMRRGNVCW